MQSLRSLALVAAVALASTACGTGFIGAKKSKDRAPEFASNDGLNRGCLFTATSKFAVENFGQSMPGSFCYQFYNDKVVNETFCAENGGVIHEGCPLKDVVARCKVDNDAEVIYYSGFDGVDCDA
jgi:hypothetical protein